MGFRIALDVMGGDFAPYKIIEGALLAKEEFGGVLDLVLVGEKTIIEKYLKKLGRKFTFSIEDAPQIIKMDDPPAVSVKNKRQSSIVRGVELVKKGEVQGFVSAGNTGAVVAASTIFLGLLPGIHRPGIALVIPTLKGRSLLIDVGANIDPKPIHLLQYAIMGEAYYRLILGKKNVRVGLLNIGEEASKGTELMRESYKLLSSLNLNFLGNVEAKDIFSGKCDVIVCDGFVGNVALKVSEGFAEVASRFLKQIFKKDYLSRIGFLFIKRALKNFSQMIDYAEYGGAPLLGVGGVVIICHGRSDERAIKNAIRVSLKEVERKLNQIIVETINA